MQTRNPNAQPATSKPDRPAAPLLSPLELCAAVAAILLPIDHHLLRPPQPRGASRCRTVTKSFLRKPPAPSGPLPSWPGT
ncbi:MAG: hypothetical protein H7Z21_01365 [Hymenobacter sp.]|nr:hypothetical protein [Hymenobacter sp.]